MSAEKEATESVQAPIDQNAQATEDAKNLLAELDAESSTAADTSAKPESNGATNGDIKQESADQATEDKEDADAEPSQDKSRKRRFSGERRERGGHRPSRGGNRGGRGGSSANYRDNIKSVLTDQEKSDDPAAIRKQVEFYFSDSNLPMDKFLLEKVSGSKNYPVDLSIIRSFKRMRHFEPLEAVVEALRESEIVQLTDNDTKVQRKVPLPENIQDRVDYDAIQVYEDKAMPRSVYVKGFGDEKPSTQFDIEAFFAEHGPTNAIRLRRSDDKHFKGSVFVEFETEDYAKKFLELDPKPQFQGRDLQIMSKKAYCDQKVEDIKSGKVKPNNKDYKSNSSSRGNRRGSFKDRRGGRNGGEERDWRTRRDEDRKNGFRDDNRRGKGDRRSDNRNRDRKKGEDEQEFEKDEQGIPKIKSSVAAEEREAQKQDALNRAKALVEAEENKKRGREEDTAEEPPAKKLDVKEES